VTFIEVTESLNYQLCHQRLNSNTKPPL